MSLVLDNSVALAWCFADEQTPAVIAVLHRVAATGACAPGLWPLEAVNGLLMAERRGRIDRGRRHALLGFLRQLPILIDAGPPDSAWGETMDLAERFHLTAYDASYLGLALRRRLPLATLDTDLRRAASKLNVPVVGT